MIRRGSSSFVMSFVLPVFFFVPSLRFVPVGSSLVFAMERKKRCASATPKTTNERNVWWTWSSCTHQGAVARPRRGCICTPEEGVEGRRREGVPPFAKRRERDFRSPCGETCIEGYLVPRSKRGAPGPEVGGGPFRCMDCCLERSKYDPWTVQGHMR